MDICRPNEQTNNCGAVSTQNWLNKQTNNPVPGTILYIDITGLELKPRLGEEGGGEGFGLAYAYVKPKQ
jgi:hypothetical protein